MATPNIVRFDRNHRRKIKETQPEPELLIRAGGFLLFLSAVKFRLNRKLTATEWDRVISAWLREESPDETAYRLRLAATQARWPR